MHEAIDLATPVLILSLLLLLATSSALLLKRLNFPYTIGLVVIGIILAGLARYSQQLDLILRVGLNHDLIMYVLLPVLIFDAALQLKLPYLVRELSSVLTLAVPGVVLSMLFIGYLMEWLTPLTLTGALLFGALISATDPVAVIALFKELGAPERMSALMDSESLFNDATAIVIFGIVLSVYQSGEAFSGMTLAMGILSFIKVFFGGLAVGTILGLLMCKILEISHSEPFVQIAHTSILAYTSFVVADHIFGFSGVMATIAAGLLTRTALGEVVSDQVRQFIKPHWEFMAFVANSLIFLLLGVKEDLLFRNLDRLGQVFLYLMLAIVVVMMARFLVIYVLLPMANRLPGCRRIDGKIKAVMFWGGLRGVVPIALMLMIPEDMAHRQLIIDMTLAVILFSLLVQGTTISWLMNRLKVNQKYHVVRAAMKKLGDYGGHRW